MKFKGLILILLVLLLAGCGKETRTVVCDGCGADITVEADSNITDEWTIFCEQCEQEAFGGTGVVEAG